MIIATYALLALVAVIACAFVAVPILRRQNDRRGAVLAAAATLFLSSVTPNSPCGRFRVTRRAI